MEIYVISAWCLLVKTYMMIVGEGILFVVGKVFCLSKIHVILGDLPDVRFT